ncbi:hypothetical protein JCM11491_000266 [Sporobolomyces phaffii]
MSLFSPAETVVPPSQPPSPAPPDRQRASSFSDNFKSANSSFRRRSSAGGVGAASTPGTHPHPHPFLRSPVLVVDHVPTLKTLDSYNARNVAAALDSGLPLDHARTIDDVWQNVCVRVLPLFNGEGIRGFVEDLNDLVLTHVQRTFARVSATTTSHSSTRYRSSSTAHPSLDLASLVTGLLIADLTDLVRIGCSTLATKLSRPADATATTGPRDDAKLVDRLNEIWLFFYTGILPHLEAVFWVLRSDDRLRAAVGGTGTALRHQERGRNRGEGKIDVRRVALIEFRDGILHPEFARIRRVFQHLSAPAHAPNDGDENVKPPAAAHAGGPTPPVVDVQDIRRSRSQPRPSPTPSTTLLATTRPPRTAASTTSTFLSPPPTTGPVPVPTTHPPTHLPTTPIRQLSSPARLPSPDPSPSNSPTATRRNSLVPPNTTSSSVDADAPSGGGGGRGRPPTVVRQTRQSVQRRLQMVLVLRGLRTNDDRQAEVDALARAVGGGGGGGGGRTRISGTRATTRGGGGPNVARKRRSTRHDDTDGASYSGGQDRVTTAYRGQQESEDGNDDEDDEDKRRREEEDQDEDDEDEVGVDSPRILFDEPSDGAGSDDASLRTGTTRRRRVVAYEAAALPYHHPQQQHQQHSNASSAAPSRSNSRTRPGGVGGGGRRVASGGAGYASPPILSTSPTEAALDLTGLGYALSRVREEQYDPAPAPGAPGARAGEGGSESSDGVTPTASAPGSVVVVEAGFDAAKKKDPARRRSLFLPARVKMGRSNSGASSTVSLDTWTPDGPGDEKPPARRNLLLRRNSSRTSTVVQQQQQHAHELSTVLGGQGLSLEDD